MQILTTNFDLSNRLAQYTALAGAAAGLAAVPSAEAAIVYSGLVNVPIPTNVGGLYLDLTTGTTSTAAFAGWDINPYYSASSMYSSAASSGTNPQVSVVTLGGVVDSNLAVGTLVPGSLFMENNLARATNLAPGQTGIMGITFIDAGNTYHGWVRMTRGNGGPGTLVDYAYNDTPNTAILAGAVPEPGSLTMLALGAVGLTNWRRRRVA